jgi:rhodanese-related sulfurtransferase
LREKLERGGELQLVMALSAHAFEAKRIPGSRHFETVGEALEALDPHEEIVLYCATMYCPASIYAYKLLEREGFPRVRRYAGGLDDWETAGFPIENGPPKAAGPRHRPRARAIGTSRPLARSRRWPALA